VISHELLSGDDPRPVHFVGIGGAGMAGLAELFSRRGIAVSGCDQHPGSAAGDLARLGVSVVAGHDASHVGAARAVVHTSAVPPEHPELVAAREAGIPVIRRAEALGLAVNDGVVIGIAGTAGKTTTTVMTTEALREAGADPTGVTGGRVSSWGGNLSWGEPRPGAAALFVVEADEYDRSFLALSPTVAVVTNVEADHLDIYRDLEDIRETFARYVAPARVVVLCADDPGAASLALPNSAEIIRYGLESPDARLVARGLRVAPGGTAFEIDYDGKPAGSLTLPVPGVHNVRNALAALGAGIALGIPVGRMVPGLEAYSGVERRFQRVADIGGVTIVDDYAHHPAKIAATLEAARAAFPGRRLVVAFQPHLYTRTRDFADAFGRVLAAADVVYLTEIYPARERPLAGVDAGLIEQAVRRAGQAVSWRGERAALAGALASAVRPGDVVLTLGAGDITRTAGELRDILAARAGT